MKNRYVRYFSVRPTSTGTRYSVSVWDDLVKHATFFSDIAFTSEEIKSW